jgi:hypothetical protein
MFEMPKFRFPAIWKRETEKKNLQVDADSAQNMSCPAVIAAIALIQFHDVTQSVYAKPGQC